MKSTPVVFDPDGRLVGIVCEPERRKEQKLAFLLLNSGVLPRIGPHRINVRIAHRLAEEGYLSFRIDLSGQGDSRPASGHLDYWDQSIADLRAAIDYLQATLGICRVVLIGLCSGAMNSYAVALRDERVAGLLMFDGYWYRSRWSLPVEYWKRFRAAAWSEILVKARRRFSPSSSVIEVAPIAPGLFDSDGGAANPPKKDFVAGMQCLVDRGVEICMVYSGSILDYYSYGAQFRHVFAGADFTSRIRCEYRPDIDHMFLLRETQDRMVSLVTSWIADRFTEQ